MWNNLNKKCLADYPDGGKRKENPEDTCIYHLKTEEFLGILQIELNKELIGNPIPKWIYDRANSRIEILKSKSELKKIETSEEYKEGYSAALEWIKKQTEFPCEGCKLVDCSHHGTEYNCAGDCH